MRVIGGSLGGRRFYPPADKWPTRPTTDIAKEALFNILHNSIAFDEIKALDLFGGCGSQTFELFSRGCQNITYVERYYPCIKFVRKQLAEFGADDQITILKSDVFKFIKNSRDQFDYIFADPPYALTNLESLPDLIFDASLLNPSGTLVIEHDRTNSFEGHSRFTRARKYGETIFSFFA